ncbi:hypothetical protein [Devosia naphthalenivorans]|uniref:hypothetical protein n=1 Tax=Devosia naphthalenivorans TaxID=2082392 RepID=UPI0013B05C8C|nr:hypothetical protein [Devosia naphthalenivorans]
MFEDDGCTLFPDQWAGQSLNACCAAHDEAFATSRDIVEFWNAGVALYRCVRPINEAIALLMLIGVLSPVALGLFLVGRKRKKEGAGQN